MGANVGEVGGDAAGHVADAEQQHVGRGLDDDQADDLVDQVAAGHEAVEADRDDPGDHQEREDLHQSVSPDCGGLAGCGWLGGAGCRTISDCSSSSAMIATNAAATSIPTSRLISAIVPDELTEPGILPSGREL